MRVLVTGAAGRIGSTVINGLKHKYEFRGLDVAPMPNLKDSIVGSSNDWATVEKAMPGVDTVIHLSNNGPEWEQAKQSMIATYNVYELAARNGVKHIAFASRAGLLPRSYYPRTMTRTADLLPRPDSYYSITKSFGEAMGDMYSAKHGISIVSVRIGNFSLERDKPADPHHLSHGDCVRLWDAAISYNGGKHVRVFGVSDSNWPVYDLDHGRKTIGYYPQDKSIVPKELQVDDPPKKK